MSFDTAFVFLLLTLLFLRSARICAIIFGALLVV